MVLNIDPEPQGSFIDSFPRVILAPENSPTFFPLLQHIPAPIDP